MPYFLFVIIPIAILIPESSAAGQSLPAVVAGRIVSGVGGAGMDSLVNILITGRCPYRPNTVITPDTRIDLVPPRDVGSWRGYVNIVATTGRSLGGPVGGYLADTIGWRWYVSFQS